MLKHEAYNSTNTLLSMCEWQTFCRNRKFLRTLTSFVVILAVKILETTLKRKNNQRHTYIESKVPTPVQFCPVHIHITLYINNCIVKMTQVFTCIIYFI